MANDSHDRLLTPTEAEIEWDYSKPRLRANVRRKANGKQKSPRDRRALANKLKRGCDENALDRLCSPLNLRSRSYKQRKSRECESDGRSRRAKKTAQTRERLRSLVLQFEAFEADGNDQHVSVGGEDLEALCAGIENETWESDEGDVGQRVSRDDDSSRRHDPVVELTASIRSEEEGKRSVDSEGCNLVQPNDIRSVRYIRSAGCDVIRSIYKCPMIQCYVLIYLLIIKAFPCFYMIQRSEGLEVRYV